MLNYHAVLGLGFAAAAKLVGGVKKMDGCSGKAVCLAALLLAGGFVPSARAGDELPLTAKILKVSGKARFSTDQKRWQVLKKGAVLNAGTLIQTAGNSSVDLELGAQVGASAAAAPGAGTLSRAGGLTPSLLRLMDDSVLMIDKIMVTPTGVQNVVETSLDLRTGDVMGRVKSLSPESRYEIKYPAGIVGVRDGSYHLSSTGAVGVPEGEAIIAWPLPDGTATSKIVTAGHRFDPNTRVMSDLPKNSATDKPIRLLPLPRPAAVATAGFTQATFVPLRAVKAD